MNLHVEGTAQLHVQLYPLQGLPKGLSIKEAALAALHKASYMPLREPEEVAKLEAYRQEVHVLYLLPCSMTSLDKFIFTIAASMSPYHLLFKLTIM